MKTALSLFVALFAFVSVSFAQDGVATFAKEAHDFGKVEQGKPVTYVFTFKNTGTAPIVVTDATASCGCTKPSWSKEPVAPGQSGQVSATFNAASPGPFNKTVTVTSNAKTSTVYLTLKGEVVSKEAAAAAAQANPASKKKGTK
ncbi:DUF1573 domain-containing protein [Fibrivirga algicola]|uniref:DUF1573 domain-containing protein n=1 Tax=Fibrivirga algicola TaxID=2950420 RepID=A0ABX0QGX7_9BACT|nr:DUF1573 domain-containing protein [Fibrivirga algicola]ARK09919.1 hypothetical protein A6C57_05965 [Fibrella sp. ES10-3-2-2]NID11645.1 DUF1573 domain-containing protein [Fibrivirga algicola]